MVVIDTPEISDAEVWSALGQFIIWLKDVHEGLEVNVDIENLDVEMENETKPEDLVDIVVKGYEEKHKENKHWLDVHLTFDGQSVRAKVFLEID